MKKGLLFWTLLIVAFTSIAQSHKTLFVIVDGIAADVIEKQATPHLDAIAKEGGYTRAFVGGEKDGYSQTPTISAVGYNTVLTGTWVNKHNVWDNNIKDPNYNYPTIFRLFKDQYPDKKTGVFSTWLDNRTRLIGDGLPQTKNIKMDYQYDGLELDTINFPQDKAHRYIHLIDEAVVAKAAATIKEDAPDLSWVYLQYTDDMGHMYGDSPAYHEAIRLMDIQMGQLWEALRYRQQQHGENWQIYITTDHGRDAATGKHHGGQSDRERSGWIITNAKNLNQHFHKGNTSIADIMPSIARFMNIALPDNIRREVDGVSLIGKVSIENAAAALHNNQLTITWRPLQSKGKAIIRISTTNTFKTGGDDDYRQVKKVKLKKGKAIVAVNNPAGKFYKIVIEAPHNTLNRWVIVN